MAASLAAPMAADAQERIRRNVVETERRLDSVEVTAQRRVEDIQDVPISIQAFDATDLETFRINGFDDLQTFTPGLISSPTPADSSGLNVVIRGIGNDDPQIGLDTPTGFYVNGIYIGKTPGLSFDSPDIERIEVLRGPQGTLYGRNTIAGAVNIITKGAEIGEYSARFGAEAGNFDSLSAFGNVNVPIGDQFAVKVAATTTERDGYVENTGPGADFGGIDRTGVTVDVAWEPTSNFRIEYGYEFNESSNEPFFNQPIPGSSLPTAFFAPILPPSSDDRIDEVESQVFIETTDSEVMGHRVTAEWDWSENHQLKGLFGYRTADVDAFTAFFPELEPLAVNAVFTTPDPATGVSLVDALNSIPAVLAGADAALAPFGLDAPGTRPDFNVPFTTPFAELPAVPFPIGPFSTFGAATEGGIPTLDDHDQFSIEFIQTGSLFGDKVEYTAGIFYFNEQTAAGPFGDRPGDAISSLQLLPALGLLGPTSEALAAIADPTTPPEALPELAAGLDGLADALGAVLTAARSSGNRIEVDTDAFAIYGQATWRPIERLGITAGLRYSRDDREGFVQGVSPFFNDLTDLTGAPIAALEADEVFDSVDPTVIVEFDLNDDVLLYAKYAQAFQSGGFNQPSVTLDDFVFDEQRNRSVEFGFKSDTFNNRVRLNANAFFSFVDDQQFTFTDPLNPIARVISNNDAQFFGIEVEGQFVVSEYLTASFNYAFLDAEADPFTNPFTGEPIPETPDNAPRNSYSINLDYVRPVPTFFDGELAAHIGFNHKDSTTVVGVPRTDSNLLDARLGYTFNTDGGYAITVYGFGQNLTDDEFTIDALDSFAAVAASTQVFGLPRTFGGGVTVEF